MFVCLLVFFLGVFPTKTTNKNVTVWSFSCILFPSKTTTTVIAVVVVVVLNRRNHVIIYFFKAHTANIRTSTPYNSDNTRTYRSYYFLMYPHGHHRCDVFVIVVVEHPLEAFDVLERLLSIREKDPSCQESTHEYPIVRVKLQGYPLHQHGNHYLLCGIREMEPSETYLLLSNMNASRRPY